MSDSNKAFEIVVHIIAISSIVSLMLPPIEVFNKFPRFQDYYSVLVQIIDKWGGLNLRGKIAQAYNKRQEENINVEKPESSSNNSPGS